MWPLLITSLVAVAMVFERLLFLIREKSRRQPEVIERILKGVERNDMASAIQAANGSSDFVARTLVDAIEHREKSFFHALLRTANR